MQHPSNAIVQTLIGRRIVVAASEEVLHRISSTLEAMGANVIQFPSTKIREFQDKQSLSRAIARLSEYVWMIFTSANGARYFSKSLDEAGIHRSIRENLPVCAVGPATARAAVECGFKVTLVPREFIAEGILRALDEQPGGLEALRGRAILIPRAREARDVLRAQLERSGAIVDVVPCYESVPGDLDEPTRNSILASHLDLLVFTSSANLSNFVTILGREHAIRILAASAVAVLGPVVASTAESFGKRPEIQPAESTVDSLLRAIEAFFRHDPHRESTRRP